MSKLGGLRLIINTTIPSPLVDNILTEVKPQSKCLLSRQLYEVPRGDSLPAHLLEAV
jgi:hypothetical protein